MNIPLDKAKADKNVGAVTILAQKTGLNEEDISKRIAWVQRRLEKGSRFKNFRYYQMIKHFTTVKTSQSKYPNCLFLET